MSRLFEPIKIGPLLVKNRFMMAPMENGLAEPGGWVNDRLIEFMKERAANGVGIIMTGSIAVSVEGRGLPTQLALYDPQYMEGLKRLGAAIHEKGARVGAQLYHAGRQATPAITGIQPVAPSAVPCALLGNDPRAMEEADFDRIRDDFVTCARRAVQAGFDLIEIHLAHGYLLHSFLSPHSNHRTDRYGGSLENRLRYPLEVVGAVLEACGNAAAVTARVSCEEFLEDGLKFAEVKTVCRRLEEAGIQALSVTAASYDSVEYIIQPMYVKQGFLVPYARELKKVVTVPVIVAARLNDANLVHDIVENGDADMVAIGRGFIADEEFAVKMREKRYDDIRYCVACNQGCIDRVLMGQGIHCLVNARAGMEAERRIAPAKVPRRVLVIGSGPAGLEAARVARLRGHEVTVVDRAEQKGGKFALLHVPPQKGSFILARDYLMHQAKKLGVSFATKEIVRAEDVEEFTPDAVVVATGARQTKPKIPGIENRMVVLAEDVLRDKVPVGATVAVIGGGLVGLETARTLAEAGKKVYVVEMLDEAGKEYGITFAAHVKESLREKGVAVICSAKVQSIEPGKVVLSDTVLPADTVVIAAGYVSNCELVDGLKGRYGADAVFTVGDAKAPRRVLEAVTEGFLAGNAV